MRSKGLVLNEVEGTWWNSTSYTVYLSGLAFYMLSFYANYLFDNLPLSHVTHLQRVDCFYRLDVVVNCEIQPDCLVREKKTTQKASSQFSGCFSVESIHPGIKSTFWKWDDNSFSHHLVCVSANRDVVTGKTTRNLWKFRALAQHAHVGLNIQQIT